MGEVKKLFLFIILAAGFIILVGLLAQGKLSLQKAKSVKISNQEIEVLLADTPEERRQGLSNREKLEENQGMLFVFDQKDIQPAFWMKDMRFAIDIIWINDSRVVEIHQNVEPEPGKSDNELKLYIAREPIDYVFEVNAGTANQKGIKVGDSVDLTSVLN